MRTRRTTSVAATVRAVLVALMVSIALPPASVANQTRGGTLDGVGTVPTTLEPTEWEAFKQRFVRSDGRVVDVEKNGVSHSEGQSYGMLLAVYADDQATFDNILNFTFSEMRRGKDRLISWLYDPRANPPVTDRNNASDGDIVIAYSLLKAGMKWQDPRYVRLAEPIINDIGRLLLAKKDGMVLLRPGAFGFDHSHQEGPVVNLSYYVYGALLLFETVNARHPFLEAWQSGLMLTEAAVSRSNGHAPDWITMRRDRALSPAQSFAQRSSYDAVRIPLFMAMGGRVPARYFAPFDHTWNIAGDRVPEDIDLSSGKAVMAMNEPGYRAIAALTACAARGVPLGADVKRFEPTTYFSSALHLMVLVAARAYHPHCIEPRGRIASQTDNSFDVAAVFLDRGASTEGRVRTVSLDNLPGFAPSRPLGRSGEQRRITRFPTP
ncbi:MAG: glycosyl hydrolase family 8 [Pseudomonadota bacterium]